MDETTLVELCARGDEAAWERFMSEYSNTIFTSIRRTLERCCHNAASDITEDIFGEVILSLIENGGRKLLGFEGRNGSRLSTYLWVLSSRTAIDHLRKTSRHPRIADMGEESMDFAPDCRELPDALLERRQQEAEVEYVLGQLSANDRLFVRLYYEKGLSTDEIAGILDITPSAVYSKKNRVREKMREIFGKKSGNRASNYTSSSKTETTW